MLEYLIALQVMFLVIWRMLPFILIALPFSLFVVKLLK
jgi:hypothetical protein